MSFEMWLRDAVLDDLGLDEQTKRDVYSFVAFVVAPLAVAAMVGACMVLCIIGVGG